MYGKMVNYILANNFYFYFYFLFDFTLDMHTKDTLYQGGIKALTYLNPLKVCLRIQIEKGYRYMVLLKIIQLIATNFKNKLNNKNVALTQKAKSYNNNRNQESALTR